MKKLVIMTLLLGASMTMNAQTTNEKMTAMPPVENLQLTQEWDKVFPKSDKVDHKKVTFINRYGITLAVDMYTPKNATGKLAAIAVSGPFGAVKEQSSGIYAQTLAERGFHPRSVNSVDGWNQTSALSFINLPFLKRSNEIQSAVLIIHGDQAHSYYFSKDAYANMMQDGNSVAAKAGNKEFLTIKGASHTDLYDQVNIIPFDKIAQFYTTYLK